MFCIFSTVITIHLKSNYFVFYLLIPLLWQICLIFNIFFCLYSISGLSVSSVFHRYFVFMHCSKFSHLFFIPVYKKYSAKINIFLIAFEENKNFILISNICHKMEFTHESTKSTAYLLILIGFYLYLLKNKYFLKSTATKTHYQHNHNYIIHTYIHIYLYVDTLYS